MNGFTLEVSRLSSQAIKIRLELDKVITQVMSLTHKNSLTNEEKQTTTIPL